MDGISGRVPGILPVIIEDYRKNMTVSIYDRIKNIKSNRNVEVLEISHYWDSEINLMIFTINSSNNSSIISPFCSSFSLNLQSQEPRKEPMIV